MIWFFIIIIIFFVKTIKPAREINSKDDLFKYLFIAFLHRIRENLMLQILNDLICVEVINIKVFTEFLLLHIPCNLKYLNKHLTEPFLCLYLLFRDRPYKVFSSEHGILRPVGSRVLKWKLDIAYLVRKCYTAGICLYNYANPAKNYEIEFIKSKNENEKLKLENEKKDKIIKGLQSNYSQKGLNTQGKKKKIAKKKNELESQEIKNDYLALIARLREQLKMATEDKRNLIDEIKNIKEAYSNINININNNPNNYPNSNNYTFNNKRNQELASKMADLNTNYESAQMKLDTQNKILEMTKRSLEEYMNKYERERDNCRKLQTELSLLKGQSDQIENYKKQLDYYKLNEAKLQEELNDLRISPFIKQAEERGNVYRNLQITQKKLTETKKNLDEKEKKLNEAELKLGSLERENEELKRSLNLEKIDKEKYKEESLKLKITRIEREKSDKLFQDKLNKYNQYGEINSDFTNLLSIYKRQNDELNWANINFIKPELLKEKNPDILLKENERLRLEKTALGKELENAKNSLLIQQQINTEFKKEKDYENEKNKSEIKLLKNKIEELCKLIDIKKNKKDYNNLSQTNTPKQCH